MVDSLKDPLVRSYIFYSAVLTLKLLLMSSLTTLVRMKRRVFSNTEDINMFGGKVRFDDQIVERVRRAHLNDLENIPAFWILGAFYVTTGPGVAWATLLFQLYTICRFVHTFVYAIAPLPQPSRAIAYLVPYAIKWYMGVIIVLFYFSGP